MDKLYKNLKESWKRISEKEYLHSGMSDGMTLEDIFDKHSKTDKNLTLDDLKKQLVMGIKVEREHTDNADIAAEIAKDHLAEFPRYYTGLSKMEKDIKAK